MNKGSNKSKNTSIIIKSIAGILAFIGLIRYINNFYYLGGDYAPNYLLAISCFLCFIGWLIGREVDFELEGDRISKLKDSIYGVIGIIVLVIGIIVSITWTKLYCHETVLNHGTTPSYCLFVGEKS